MLKLYVISWIVYRIHNDIILRINQLEHRESKNLEKARASKQTYLHYPRQARLRNTNEIKLDITARTFSLLARVKYIFLPFVAIPASSCLFYPFMVILLPF